MVDKIEFTKKPAEGEPWDVVVIGSGPSALTAAIYTTRGAVSTLVLAGERWGGQLMLTTQVDNFPGFPEGILGPDLMKNMRDQAERFSAEIVDQNANSIDVTKLPYKVSTRDRTFLAKRIIIATGSDTRWLGVPGEEKLRGRGVSSCAPCDAPFFKDKKVVVIGGGDSAMEEALVLAKYATQVIVVHRRNEFKASAAMQKRVLENDKIKVVWDSGVDEIKGDTVLSSVILKTNKNSKQYENLEQGGYQDYGASKLNEKDELVYWEMPVEGLFVAIGHIPSTDIFKGNIDLDEKGYIKRQEKDGYKTATNSEGIFVAGDVHDYHYKQAITAAGFGCMAGMDVLKSLDKSGPSW